MSPPSGQYILKHYHNGEFNKDYDRAEKVSSIVNFMKDPTGDLPWDEDPTAQDVVHIADIQVPMVMFDDLNELVKFHKRRIFCTFIVDLMVAINIESLKLSTAKFHRDYKSF